MLTCYIGLRGAVIARFSMCRPLHSSVHSGSSLPNRNADAKTVLAGILTRLPHSYYPYPVHIVLIPNAVSIILEER